MDAITNKDTPTFPMDDVVFNRLLLPDKYINSYSEDEFYAFMSKQNRVNIKRFYDQQNQKKINEFIYGPRALRQGTTGIT